MDVKYPIGELQVPENVTLEMVLQWLKQIETYTIRLRETVDYISEEELNKTYREGAWTVRQLVHHIADSQLNMYQRLKLALTDDNPTVPAFDEVEKRRKLLRLWLQMPNARKLAKDFPGRNGIPKGLGQVA